MISRTGSPYLRVTYTEDMAIINTPVRRFWSAVGLTLLLVAPLFLSNFTIHLVNLVLISLTAAVALNLLTGYTGQISLGHAALLATGAFTAAALVLTWQASVLVVLPAAVAVGALLGFLIGLPSLRFKGLYLAVVTLGVHYVIIQLTRFYQAQVARNEGIRMPDPAVGAWAISSDRTWYYVLLIIATLVMVMMVNLLRSRTGRAWMAVRDRDISAQALGISLTRSKLLAFVVSSAVTSLTGAVYAYYTHVVTVEEYTLELSIAYLAMIIVGGMGSLLGTVLGTIFIVLLPYGIEAFFDLLPLPYYLKTQVFAVQYGIYGLLIVLFLIFEPKGLVEIWRRIRVYFELWPFRYHPVDVVRR